MLTPHEAALESKCEKIARILVRHKGVKVRIEGGMAYIDLDTMTIVLPNLEGDALESLDWILDGFLDHECGHAMWTDNYIVTHELKPDPVLFDFWNPVEDSWTERMTSEQWPGCARNLRALNEAIMAENRKKWSESDPVFKVLVAMSECWRGGSDPAEFESDPHIGLVFQTLADEVRDGYLIRSTREAADLAKRIRDKIAQAAVPPPSQPKRGKGSSGQDQGASQPGGQKQSAEQSAENSEEGASGAGGRDAQKPQEALEDGSEGAGMPESGGDLQDQARALQGLLESGRYTAPTDAEDLFNDNLTKVPKNRRHGDPEEYIVFSEEFDIETHYSSEQRLAWSGEYKRLQSEVSGYIGTMSTVLEDALAAESEARWVGGSRRGRKFDKRVFPVWTQGGHDDRIYRHRTQSESWDTAVSLLWDCSGSMQRARPGTKSYLARLAAIAFHEALTRVNIMHEVLGFNTGETDSHELGMRIQEAERRGEDLTRYSRLEKRDQRMVFVPWGSPDGRAICAITGSDSNRDGECVRWAAKRLAARSEIRKVLIVGSDGQPAGARYGYTEEKYLQKVVRDVITAGIEVYAIGIMDDSVQEYYPHWVVIHKAEDLPKAVLRQLGQALFAHKGTTHGDLPLISKPES